MAAHTASMTLVQDAKQGDQVAFMSFLEPLLEPGYRLACGMLHDHQAAEDAVQEAAFKAWRKLVQLRDGHEPRPWFLGIVANECRTVRRSRWWSVLKWPESEHAVEDSPDSALSGIELRRVLRGLDMDKRLVLVLHWYLDLPLDEISVITGSSVHAVESRLQRGMHELRRRMEGRDAN
jgi:RNA polymerase sigma-70 factor (ECF subfamily)